MLAYIIHRHVPRISSKILGSFSVREIFKVNVDGGPVDCCSEISRPTTIWIYQNHANNGITYHVSWFSRRISEPSTV